LTDDDPRLRDQRVADRKAERLKFFTVVADVVGAKGVMVVRAVRIEG
jgi:hypothetical protein